MLTEEKIRSFFRKTFKIEIGKIERDKNDFLKAGKLWAVYMLKILNSNTSGQKEVCKEFKNKINELSIQDTLTYYVSDLIFL